MPNERAHPVGTLVPPDTGDELLAWQIKLEMELEASLVEAFAGGLQTIRSLALGRSLTQAAASQAWVDAVDSALAAHRLPDDPAVRRLRDELLAMNLGDQAYESVMAVDTLYRQQLARPAHSEYLAALDEALGLEQGTMTLTAAGALERVKQRVLNWMKPAKREGLSWRSQISRGVRSGFTGLTGSLVMAKLSATGHRAKRWVTKEDQKVRDTHRAAHGQVVPLNAPFVVGGQMLMFPGDPHATAGETINCRCVMVAGD